MTYDYNGELEFEERIANVSHEIIKKYPSISKKEAIIISTLEPPITTPSNFSIQFNRLHNILLVIDKTSNIYQIVLNDLKKLYNKNLQENGYKNTKEDKIMEQILKEIET